MKFDFDLTFVDPPKKKTKKLNTEPAAKNVDNREREPGDRINSSQ